MVSNVSAATWAEIRTVKQRLANMIDVLEDLAERRELPSTTVVIVRKTLYDSGTALLKLSNRVQKELVERN